MAKKKTQTAAPQKPAAKRYRVLRGITYAKTAAIRQRVIKAGGRSAMSSEAWREMVARDYHRAEIGDVVSNIPAPCIADYLRKGAIEEVADV